MLVKGMESYYVRFSSKPSIVLPFKKMEKRKIKKGNADLMPAFIYE